MLVSSNLSLLLRLCFNEDLISFCILYCGVDLPKTLAGDAPEDTTELMSEACEETAENTDWVDTSRLCLREVVPAGLAESCGESGGDSI